MKINIYIIIDIGNIFVSNKESDLKNKIKDLESQINDLKTLIKNNNDKEPRFNKKILILI